MYAPPPRFASTLVSSFFETIARSEWLDLCDRVKKQETCLAALRETIGAYAEETFALRKCLEENGVVNALHFSIQLHRNRFNAARNIHGLATTAQFSDVLTLEASALDIGLAAGSRALWVLAAASRGVCKTAKGVWSQVTRASAQDIYVFGGTGISHVLVSGGRFTAPSGADAICGSWETFPLAVEPRVAATGTAVGGKLYVCGGWGADDVASSSVERFDPAIGAWEDIASMATSRASAGSASVGGCLFVCGGYDSEMRPIASTECFDAAIGHWESLPPLRTARASCAAVSHGGKILTCGGYAASFCTLQSVEQYCRSTRSWKHVPMMLEARAGAAAAGLSGRVLVCGGMSLGRTTTLKCVESFTDERGVWERVAPMAVHRANAAFAASGGRMYVFGGHGVLQNSHLRSGEVFDPLLNIWTAIPEMAEGRAGATAVAAW